MVLAARWSYATGGVTRFTSLLSITETDFAGAPIAVIGPRSQIDQTSISAAVGVNTSPMPEINNGTNTALIEDTVPASMLYSIALPKYPIEKDFTLICGTVEGTLSVSSARAVVLFGTIEELLLLA